MPLSKFSRSDPSRQSSTISARAALAAASSWMVTTRPAVQALQCPAPTVTASPLFMKSADFVMAMEDELDNSAIAEDESIMPARKCGFCMG